MELFSIHFSYLAFGFILFPLTAVLFFKRFWLLINSFRLSSPVDLIGGYFLSRPLRYLIVWIALFFSVAVLCCFLMLVTQIFSVLDYDYNTLAPDLVAPDTLTHHPVAQDILQTAGGALNTHLPFPAHWHHLSGTTRGWLLLTSMVAYLGVLSSPAFIYLISSPTKARTQARTQIRKFRLLMGSGFILSACLGLFILMLDFSKMGESSSEITSLANFSLSNASLLSIIVMILTGLLLLLLTAVCTFLLYAAASLADQEIAFLLHHKKDRVYKDCNSAPNNSENKVTGRCYGIMGLVFILALLLVLFSPSHVLIFGALAPGFGLQLWPLLLALCYVPWLTRAGITSGLSLGLISAALAELDFYQLLNFGDVIWLNAGSPVSVHSSVLGLSVNLAVAVSISFFTQSRNSTLRRLTYQRLLVEHASVPLNKEHLVPVGWGLVLCWFFFAIGPGSVLAADILANKPLLSGWTPGITAFQTWQLFWFGFGIHMIWFLAVRLEFTTISSHQVFGPFGFEG